MAGKKPRVGVFKFSSCDGCQLSLLDCEDELLAVKARVHECHSTQATVEAINRVEKVVRAAFPSVRWCFFEPDDHN